MVEVCLFTALLGLAMHALPGLQAASGEVNAPGHPGVRDYMLRYMAEVFVGSSLGATMAHVAAWIVSIVIAGLLLSAVNTCIVALITIQFLMSRDGELPPEFQRMNRFGVPRIGMIVATAIPILLVLFVRDVSGLADLYAIGVVGAIAANLGSTATDRKIGLVTWERILMFLTFLIMGAIELSLFVDKPRARLFVVTILAIGLIMRSLASERAQKKKAAAVSLAPSAPVVIPNRNAPLGDSSKDPLLCAVRGIGKTVEFAIEEAQDSGRRLYILFVREQAVVTPEDRQRKWYEDPEAKEIFDYVRSKADKVGVIPCYTVSDSPADTIVDIAATLGVGRLILGAPQRAGIVKLLRGNIVRQVADSLPENIHLLLCA
jgi:nucleotide-binding universal stress UspA family protein